MSILMEVVGVAARESETNSDGSDLRWSLWMNVDEDEGRRRRKSTIENQDKKKYACKILKTSSKFDTSKASKDKKFIV
ncbi:hypothetical protein MTR_7g034080 [Medicago truncatula]|uniref:Uncharacterized protein n=1 Tax=Medicago truncatula TaxID=3880 RepID=A0A072TZ89_MEDTR|nr:hypothetical protein MTR_7g034080 [Medicago truncatula]